MTRSARAISLSLASRPVIIMCRCSGFRSRYRIISVITSYSIHYTKLYELEKELPPEPEPEPEAEETEKPAADTAAEPAAEEAPASYNFV